MTINYLEFLRRKYYSHIFVKEFLLTSRFFLVQFYSNSAC